MQKLFFKNTAIYFSCNVFFPSPDLKASWSNVRSSQHKILAVLPVRDRIEKQSPDDVIESVHSQYVLTRTDGVFAEPLDHPRTLAQVAWIRIYAAKTDDVRHILELVCRCVYQQQDIEVEIGPPLLIRSDTVPRTPEPPTPRRMMNLTSSEVFRVQTRPGAFRVLIYNLLAEIYMSGKLHPNCPS